MIFKKQVIEHKMRVLILYSFCVCSLVWSRYI